MRNKILLSLLAVVSTLTATAHDFTDQNDAGVTIYYNITSPTTASVTFRGEDYHANFDTYTGDLVIPEKATDKFNGTTYTVTEIGDYAFYGCDGLSTLTTPSSLWMVGAWAFYNCKELRYFYSEYASSDKRCLIKDHTLLAFAQSGLRSYTIPIEVNAIGDFAFASCNQLTQVTMHPNVTSIGERAFLGCRGMKSIDIPESVKTIGDCAFGECGITSISIPNSVTSAGVRWFVSCYDLTSVKLSDSMTEIGHGMFIYCPALESVTINAPVKSVGRGAFFQCTNLKAFYGSSASADNRCLVVDGKLMAVAPAGLTSYTIPETVKSIAEYTFCNLDNLNEVYMGDSVVTIDAYAFYDNITLNTVVIGNSVTSIGDYAFNNDIALRRLRIGNSVVNIGEEAFSSCHKLESIDIPNSVVTLGAYAFADCRNATEINLGRAVKSIGAYALSCPALKSFTVHNSDPTSINLEHNVFSYVPYKSCVLHVPQGSKKLYAAAPQWCEFVNIVEFESQTEEYTAEGLVYDFTDNTHTAYKVIGHTDELPADVSIPPTYQGLPVTEIGKSAFSENTNLSSILLPNSIIKIDELAFKGCSGLSSIDLPNSLKEIETMAFRFCTGFTTIEIPETLEVYGAGMLEGCTNLSSIYSIFSTEDHRCMIGGGVLMAFAPAGLTSYTLPSSISIIGERSMSFCRDLTSIEIPNTVQIIEDDAFTSCTGFSSIDIPNSITEIRTCAFYGCNGLKSVTLPNSVKTLGVMAFAFCRGLESVYIPESVVSISNEAFAYCEKLASITVCSPNPADIALGDAVFGDTQWSSVPKDTCVLRVPKGSKELYASAPQWCEFANIVEFELPSEEYTTVGLVYELAYDQSGYYVKDYTDELPADVSIPPTHEGLPVIGIGDRAFWNCNQMTSVKIPNSITYISNRAFFKCNQLKTIHIPESVKDFGQSIMYWCENLESITGKYSSADHRCLIIDGELNSFARAGLTSYQVPDNVTSIGEYAFFYCTDLTSIELPSTVTEIKDRAFYVCLNLCSINLPDAVTTIGKFAFGQLEHITNITMPKSLVTIDDYAFTLCVELKSIELPERLARIGNSAFNVCQSLTSVIIPASVTYIDTSAFAGCSALTSVTVCNTDPTTIELGDTSNIFAGVDFDACTLYVPRGSKELYSTAPMWQDFANIVEIDIPVDGVTSAFTEGCNDEPYYDLMGRRVDNPVSGLYIRGGRKVLIK